MSRSYGLRRPPPPRSPRSARGSWPNCRSPRRRYQMSPFAHADTIKAPLLLIHGEADNNSGTFPIQSERLFSAIKGQGGTVRFVLLPLESHGYAARESVLHMFWEM